MALGEARAWAHSAGTEEDAGFSLAVQSPPMSLTFPAFPVVYH